MDPLHFEYLHAHYGNYYNSRRGLPPTMNTPRHVKIDFDVFEYGIYKRRLLEGQTEDCDDWQIGHPVLFPNILQVGSAPRTTATRFASLPTTRTRYTSSTDEEARAGDAPKPIEVKRESVMYDDLGLVDAPVVLRQDEMAWIGQGPLSDRTQEHLVTSDKGIMLYHNLLLSNMETVERGDDPMGIVRGPGGQFPADRYSDRGSGPPAVRAGRCTLAS